VRKIIECVPNFSEGRRREVVDALAAALTGPRGVALLDSQMDGDHNRCVISVAGEPEAVMAGVLSAVGKAIECIDLREQSGEHPRIGATDVVPLIPIAGITMGDCIALSRRLGAAISDQYDIPVYLYEQSARVAARQNLAYIRRGNFEGLRDEIRTDPERKPDYGPLEVHPTAGATAVGARSFLIAYNVYLRTNDLSIAKAIAHAVRFSSGGLRYVKALAFTIKDRNQVQVSMNLINFEGTPIFRAFEMVAREAERYGVAVASSEIVGLVPQEALNACSASYLRLEGFSKDQVLENRLAEMLPADSSMEDYLTRVAAADAVPGGGSVGAMAGALAAALGSMVAGLTTGRQNLREREPQALELHDRFARAQNLLQTLGREDGDAYGEVMAAFRLPKGTDEEKSTRGAAIQKALKHATEIPLQTARVALEVLELLGTLFDIGNPNARSDAATGVQLAAAAVKGAQYNVLVNIKGLEDHAFAERSRIEVQEIAARSQPILQRVDSLMAE